MSSMKVKAKRSGHTRPRMPSISLDCPGRVRVSGMLALLGVAHATFYAGLRSGRYPAPDGRDGKLPWWSTSTVRPLVEAPDKNVSTNASTNCNPLHRASASGSPIAISCNRCGRARSGIAALIRSYLGS